MNKCLKIVGCFLLLDFFLLTSLWGQINVAHQKGIVSGEVWKDTDGNVINAHGGGILFNNGKYYWFGEHRPSSGFTTQVGVTCYMEAYDKEYYNFTISDIEALTDVRIERNKRDGRSQKGHLKRGGGVKEVD